jgi:hypothetical protein
MSNTASLTADQRFAIAVMGGATFALVSSPQAYELIENVTGIDVSLYGRPKMMGLALHSAVFAGALYFILAGEKEVESYL